MTITRVFLWTTIAMLVCGALVVTSPPAIAAPQGSVFIVTRLDDPAPNGCLKGDCSLREAIIAANANSDVSTVTIPVTGTIELAIAGANEDAAATGDLDITTAMTISGVSETDTVIDANGLDRVFEVPALTTATGMGETSRITDLTVTGGFVSADSDSVGGGIRVVGGQIELNNLVITGNDGDGGAFGLGGGVANDGGNVTIFGSAIINNAADNAGGISNLDGTMNISNSTISGNAPRGAVGGIINLANTAGITATLGLDSVTIAYNVEGSGNDSGAGLDTTAFDGAARTTIQNVIISNNTGDAQCYAGSGNGFIISLGYNIADDASCELTGTADLPSTDPLLGALVAADGTFSHSLSNGSPALDTGGTAGTIDQRDNPRPVDLAGIPNTTDGDDRGPVEMQAEPPTAVTVSAWRVAGASDGGTGLFLLALGGLVLAGMLARRRR